MVVSLLSSYYYAYVSAYSMEQVQESLNFNILWLLFALDVFYALVIIKNFLTGFYTEGQDNVVKDYKRTINNYLKNGAVLDIVIWFPF